MAWECSEAWAVCGEFTWQARGCRLGVLPSVDKFAAVSGRQLVMDLEVDADVEFLWWLVLRHRPRHFHAGAPCICVDVGALGTDDGTPDRGGVEASS